MQRQRLARTTKEGHRVDYRVAERPCESASGSNVEPAVPCGTMRVTGTMLARERAVSVA